MNRKQYDLFNTVISALGAVLKSRLAEVEGNAYCTSVYQEWADAAKQAGQELSALAAKMPYEVWRGEVA